MKGIKELNTMLFKDATDKGACYKVMSTWEGKELNREQLVDMWLHNYDFAVRANFPDIETMRNEWDRDWLKTKGVYVDEGNVFERNKEGMLTFHGSSKGVVMFDSYSVGMVYVRHDSEINISCCGMSKVFINVYDNAKVHIEQGDIAKVYVYKRSKDCIIESEGDVLIRE